MKITAEQLKTVDQYPSVKRISIATDRWCQTPGSGWLWEMAAV